MPKDYKNISVDELLNYEDAQTSVMSRYDRIMHHRTIEAMNGLSNRLQGVIETLYRASQSAQERADKTDARETESRRAQQKQQATVTRLTWVLAICTAVYTVINGWNAYETFVGNSIQLRIASISAEQLKAAQEANSLSKGAAGRNH